MICCLIFLAFIVGMIGTSGYGYLHGDPELLLTGWDADRNGCGYSEVTKDYPYLYFPTIDFEAVKKAAEAAGEKAPDPRDVLKFSVCVKKCPSATG